MNLNEKLVALRKEKGLSQLKLAEMMNVSRQAISRWEVGAAVPSTDNLKYLGRLYDVPLEYLLHDDSPAPNKATKSTEATANYQKKRNYICLIIIVILVVSICTIIFYKKDDRPVSMNNIEGGALEAVSDFELDW